LRLKSRFQNLKPHLPLSVPLTRKLKNKQVLKFRDLRLREFYLVAPPLRTKKTRTRSTAKSKRAASQNQSQLIQLPLKQVQPIRLKQTKSRLYWLR